MCNVFQKSVDGKLAKFNFVDRDSEKIPKFKVKSVQSALSDLKRPPERLQFQCNYRPFIT